MNALMMIIPIHISQLIITIDNKLLSLISTSFNERPTATKETLGDSTAATTIAILIPG